MANPVAASGTAADVRRAPTSGGAMLYDASRAGNATEDLFRAQWWRSRAAVEVTHGGRGQAFFVEDGKRSWVLRHYHRGGSVAKVLDDRYLWTGEERTRSFREWRLLHELHREGLPVPVPIAARYTRTGAFYRGDLITERIRGARPVSQLLESPPLAPGTWQRVGACVRRFQDHGVFHADLNAHNILLDDTGEVFLIDFDRGARRPPGPWREANLARLRRSLDKVCAQLPAGRLGDDEWNALLGGYSAVPDAPAGTS